MRALTCPLVSGQMPPAVRMRCTFASRRRSIRISVSLFSFVENLTMLGVSMGVLPLQSCLLRGDLKPEFAPAQMRRHELFRQGRQPDQDGDGHQRPRNAARKENREIALRHDERLAQ